MQSRRSWVLSLMTVLLVGFTFGGCGGGKKMLFNGKNFDGWQLYLDDPTVDVDTVWSVADGVIRCEGKPNGYMKTTATYSNYKLHVEWRWAETPTNSGVLLHISGPDRVWPHTIEAQLAAGSAGDFVLIGQGVNLTVNGKAYQTASQPFTSVESELPSSEKPPGQWNTYDIICDGDRVALYVNGTLRNEGSAASKTSGWIALQSEGSPIEFRNVYIEPLD